MRFCISQRACKSAEQDDGEHNKRLCPPGCARGESRYGGNHRNRRQKKEKRLLQLADIDAAERRFFQPFHPVFSVLHEAEPGFLRRKARLHVCFQFIQNLRDACAVPNHDF